MRYLLILIVFAASNVLALSLPVIIEAESFSSHRGVQVEPTLDVGGGNNVAYLHDGDWMKYDNHVVEIPVDGKYKITYRVAGDGGGSSFLFHESKTAAEYDVVVVPATGGPQKWIDLYSTRELKKGAHTFGIKILKRGNKFNINWVKIEAIPASSVASSSKPASSKAASSAASSKPVASAPSSSGACVEPPENPIKRNVILTWEKPTKREDGAPLRNEEISGYIIELKHQNGCEWKVIHIRENVDYYKISLGVGQYLLRAQVYDVNGLYSRYSKETIKNIPAGSAHPSSMSDLTITLE